MRVVDRLRLREAFAIALGGFTIAFSGWLACSNGGTPPGGNIAAPAVDASDALPDGPKADAVAPDTSQPEAGDTDALDAPPDAKVPDGSSAYAWLFDPEAWQLVPGIEGCNVYEADPQKVNWPGHAWASCGEGCRVAPIIDGPVRAAAQHASGSSTSAWVIDGKLVVSASINMEFDPPIFLLARFGIDEQQPRTILRVHGKSQFCLARFMGASTSRVLMVTSLEDGSPVRLGIAPPTVGTRTTWPVPPLPALDWESFAFGAGWGGIFNYSTVRVSHDFHSTEMQTIHSGAYLIAAVEFGDGVFWIDREGANSTIWAWTNTGGQARRLVQGPWDIASYGVSSSKIVWLGTHGPSTSSGSFEAAELYWSDFTTNPEEVVVHEGLPLPIPSYTGQLYTEGDWAVVSRCETSGSCSMLIVRLSDQKVWSIPERPGNYEVPIAISQTEVLSLESTPLTDGGPDWGWLLRFRRHDLSKLDAYATPVL